MTRLTIASAVVVICSTAPAAWAVACTAAGAGNWSAQTTWGSAGTGCSGAASGGIPGNLDTVTIGYPVTVDVNTTIGTSQADATNVTPPTPAIILTKTTNAGAGTNGQLTVLSGVTFTVRGSVRCTGTIHSYAPIINLNPGSTWTFDNSQAPSSGAGVYRIWGTVANSFTAINAQGTGWGAGQFITINGKDTAACTAAAVSCTGAMWTNESQLTGGTFGTFTHEYDYVKWNYMGSPTDLYRSISLQCSDANGDNTKFNMLHTIWNFSAGWHAASNYPCQHLSYDVEYIQTLNSTSATTGGFYRNLPSSVAHVTSPPTVRILRYAYFDTGMDSNGGNTNFFGFDTVSYVVFDRQNTGSFCPNAVANTLIEPSNIDHMLIRQTQALGWYLCGSTSYLLVVADAGLGSLHSAQTGKLSTGSFTWNIDHAIWQYGEGTAASSDADALDARPASTTGFPTNFTYLLLLPSAASRLANYAQGQYAAVVGSEIKYNHMVMAFGQDGGGVGSSIIGSMYIGEGDIGTAGTVWIKNSIFWSPHASPDPIFMPVAVYSGGGGAGTCTSASGGIYLANCTANAFDPVNIHNNLVWNYGTASNRWTSSITGCSGGGSTVGGVCTNGCSSCGTPYDFKMTGTVPGANDLHGYAGASPFNPQYAPSFLWQTKGLKGAGPREWANIRFGADLAGSGATASTPAGCVPTDTCTQVYYATTFNVFATANPDDITSSCTDGPSLAPCAAAGLKGRIDDMFAWIYGMWASTNPALKGAADDVGVSTLPPSGLPNTAAGDIGAAPVALQCPTAPVGADPSKSCAWVSEVQQPSGPVTGR